MIQSREIKMPAKKMFGILFLENGKFWFFLVVAGVILFTLLGIAVSYKFLVLMLMWIFIITPLFTAFLYFVYGMKPLTAFNTVPHFLNVNEKGITVRIPEKLEENREIDDSGSIHREYNVDKTHFLHMKSGGDYMILFFKDGWLWLPAEGFDNFNDFKNSIEIIGKYNAGGK